MTEALDDIILNLPEGTMFHYYKHGLSIHSEIQGVEDYDNYKDVHFHGGCMQVSEDDSFKKMSRPPNLIVTCRFCYQFRNEDDDIIGYIYKSA